MIKKTWGAQSDDGREGMMNPECATSWHQHSKDTRIKVSGLMYVALQVEGHLFVRSIPEGGLTIPGGAPHCLFSVGEMVTFRESGTEIVDDITRHEWPEWMDWIVQAVRESHVTPTEGQADQSVSRVTNEADVTTTK